MFKACDFKALLGTAGFSDALLTDHFSLYEGYVTNANKLAEMLKVTESGTPTYAELKRRFSWEYNGMRLHELYFEGMSRKGSPVDSESRLQLQIKADFGSYQAWKKDFEAIGVMRGIGWAMLAYSPRDKRLFNLWLDEHDTGLLAGSVPVLTLDVFEHAYSRDYGLKRPGYIEAFMAAVDWGGVQRAFEHAGVTLVAARA